MARSSSPGDEPLEDAVDAQHGRRYDTAQSGDEGLAESYQSTATVKRVHPEGSYGTITTPAPGGSSAPGNNAPSIEGSASGHDRPRSRAAPSPMLGPESDRPRLRKPPMARRTSSSAQTPHRGAVFSVDDDPNEVEADAAGWHPGYTSSTIRRRGPPPVSKLDPAQEADETVEDDGAEDGAGPAEDILLPEPVMEAADAEAVEGEPDMPGAEDEGDLSDAESFTLKDRQQAINQTHPFGIRIWKPALYKKDRSVQKNAEGDIHSTPGGHVSSWLLFFNAIWTIVFGWWMALIASAGALVCFLFAAAPGGREYGRVLWGLSGYLFYPFGKIVHLEQQEAYLDEDQGEGRSISEYEQWQSGDLENGRLFFGPNSGRSIIGRSRRSTDSGLDETRSLLGRSSRGADADADLPRMKRRLFGRGQWNVGRVIFFFFFYLLIAPSLFVVSAVCWFLVFWIPMGKVTMLLFDHLRRHPLALSFESDIVHARASATAPHSSILLCTYRAAGPKYWKYTVDGTNIFLINLLAVVVFVVFDWLVLDSLLHVDAFVTSPAFLFGAGLVSIIPLAYFIGQAVASISAQSSMGLGAAVNAFFSTIVEVFLYCVALSQGKARLVEGSIVGSIFAGILFLPGLSMCFGAIKRKTQRFNSRSAVVTSTMLLFAVIGAFGPTLFYQIYGTHELNCQECLSLDSPTRGAIRDCRRCYFSQTPALNDRFYIEAVRPYCYLAATMLFFSYVIGLWFTLRTHAAVIWNTEADEKRLEEQALAQQIHRAAGLHAPADATGADVRDSHLYRRILGQSLRQVGQHPPHPRADDQARQPSKGGGVAPISAPPKSPGRAEAQPPVNVPGASAAESSNLVYRVAEIAATAATAAARDTRLSRRISAQGGTSCSTSQAARPQLATHAGAFPEPEELVEPAAAAQGGGGGGVGGHDHGGGHDAPNWSRLKSSIILMSATVLYAIIAEILVDTVDVVLEHFALDEKFLGITLFALVPNTTEFLNAISFAMNGNIALSMEIGSAYALQVCLLQIPALVFFSAVYPMKMEPPTDDMARYLFTLIFPQWDMATVILCVFLLSHMYGEGKSNYFKGSILLLSYLVVVTGYYFSSFGADLDNPTSPASRFDTLSSSGEWMSYGFKTAGRSTSGMAY